MPLTKAELNEWCTELENHPEQQHRESLCNEDGTKFCCLGKLAMLHGAEVVPNDPDSFVRCMLLDDQEAIGILGGRWTITTKLGSTFGNFWRMGMPDLKCYSSLSGANDAGITWPEIAAHLRKYYITSD